MSIESTRHYYRDYAKYQSHESVDQLNESIRAHLFEHKAQLTKSAVAIFKLIGRFSCVFPGVSWLKCATIAKHVGKSDKTVRMALKSLEERGLILRIATQRKQGGRGHYIFIIPRKELQDEITGRQNAIKPHENKENGPNISKETSINHDNSDVNALDYTFTPSHIPADFTRAAKPFFGAYRIYRLWGTVRVAYRQSGLEAPLEALTHVVVQAFRESIFALKARRIRGDFGGYFYGTLRGMLAIERRREVAQSGRLATLDWLAG